MAKNQAKKSDQIEDKVELRRDKFVSQAGELNIIVPQCKSCKRSVIDNGIKCVIHNTIPLGVRLNKQECEDYEKQDEE